MKIFTAIFFLLLIQHSFCQSNFYKTSVYFETDKFNLDFADSSILKTVIDSIAGYKTYKLLIRGNTDSDADSVYNLQLSQKRCTSVNQYLLLNSIPEKNITTNWYGENKPIAENETEEGKQRNRRVDIIISGIVRKSILDEIFPEETSTTTIADFYKKSKRDLQEFCIDPTKDTIIICEYGTIVYIKGNTIIYNAKSTDCVIIQVKEEYLKSDMILDNITTMSGDKILESQGMVYVQAVQGDKKLNLKSKTDYLVMTPTDTIVPGLKVFTGEEIHDQINWTVNNNSQLNDFTLEQVIGCGAFLCGGVYPGCSRCKYAFNKSDYFFCRCRRLDEGFRGIFNSAQHQQNKRFRECQRKLRRDARETRKFERRIKNGNVNLNVNINADSIINSRPTYNENSCQWMYDMFVKYGVDNIKDLVYAINKPLLDKYGATTMEELAILMEQEKINTIEMNYGNKSIAFDDFSYYIYNTSNFGWSNLDDFKTIRNPVDLKVNIRPNEFTDCKLVFINSRSVFPGTPDKKNYVFKGIPKGEEVWIVAIQYRDQVPYLGMQKIMTESKTIDIIMTEYTLEELKLELKKLDEK